MDHYVICNLDELEDLFQYIGEGPLLVLLYGPMGAGKTTFVREFLRYRGYQGRVKSPTFTYEIVYDKEKISHIDLYRIKFGITEIIDEIVDRLESGFIVFVEWPNRLSGEVEELRKEYPSIEIFIDIVDSDCRRVSIR